MARRKSSTAKLKVRIESAERASALFPAPAERDPIDDLLTRELINADYRVAKGPVIPRIDVAAFRSDLADFDFQVPRPLDELLSWTIEQMEHGLVHVTHPRYFGLFNPSPTFPAQCADRIAGAFNPQLATWTTSPVAVEIETHVIRSVARRAGLPPRLRAISHLADPKRTTALLCALSRATPESATKGARAFAGTPVFYVSQDSHLAWLKNAHQVGIGRSAVRLVATDGLGRMDQNALKDAVISDRLSRNVPIMIVATAGTTSGGMINPLWACAELARSFGLWYHIDAAWGGALIASDRLRNALSGIERAISLRSTLTSGLRRLWVVGCSSPNTRRYCRRPSRSRPASCLPTFRKLINT